MKRVAMQYSPKCAVPYVAMVDAGTVELVRDLGVEVVTSAELIQEFEAALNDQQFQSHLDAGKLVDKVRAGAFRFIGEKLSSGVDEMTVAEWIRSEFTKAGLVTDSGPIVGVNAHAGDPHYEPRAETNTPIKTGDLVLLDMWAKLNKPGAIFYDITWMGFCGTPTERVQTVFEVVRGARDAAIDRVKAGGDLRGFEVDDAARGYMKVKGFADRFVHRTGHSIGEEVHGTGANMDNLETHDDRRILPGALFSIEPGIYMPEEGIGVRSEVNMFVSKTGAQVTGEIQRELVRI
jgi:Xaa-Pro aminopeptidase